MNEKKIFIVCLICLVLFILSGCCTRAGICDNGSGAYEVREHLGELSERLEKSITDGKGDLESLAAILQRIRKRSRATASKDAGGD